MQRHVEMSQDDEGRLETAMVERLQGVTAGRMALLAVALSRPRTSSLSPDSASSGELRPEECPLHAPGCHDPGRGHRCGGPGLGWAQRRW